MNEPVSVGNDGAVRAIHHSGTGPCTPQFFLGLALDLAHGISTPQAPLVDTASVPKGSVHFIGPSQGDIPNVLLQQSLHAWAPCR